MNKIEKLTQAITDFFAEKGQHYGYDDETIKEMLRTIDFHALHRLIRREAVPVRSFIVGGEMPDILRYRGSDLLPYKAICIYSNEDFVAECHCLEQEHRLELWLMEDMTIAVTSCMMTEFGGGAYFCEYREYKGDKWPDTEVCMDVDDLLECIQSICAQDDEMYIYEP